MTHSNEFRAPRNLGAHFDYLNEAAQLGRVEAHLDLAWLYNAAGMKDKAAAEYEAFIKKKPDFPDRRKLEQYIRVNKQK